MVYQPSSVLALSTGSLRPPLLRMLSLNHDGMPVAQDVVIEPRRHVVDVHIPPLASSVSPVAAVTAVIVTSRADESLLSC
uniref:Uncharacterized protein n=1 Tax=Oryza punctata TaxID=4537 RepID=A0A0E0L1E7_ORYPU